MSYEDYLPFLQYLYLVALMVSVYALYEYLWYMYSNDKRGNTDYENLSNLVLDDNIDSKTIDTAKTKK